jgi:hypothetical protein
VTKPRARVNVSCSRAGHKVATGDSGNNREGQRKTAKEGYQTGIPDQQRLGTGPGAEQDGTGRERA